MAPTASLGTDQTQYQYVPYTMGVQPETPNDFQLSSIGHSPVGLWLTPLLSFGRPSSNRRAEDSTNANNAAVAKVAAPSAFFTFDII